MKKEYRAPFALLFQTQVQDIIAASDEPNVPDNPNNNQPNDPITPGPGGDTSSPSDPAAPDLDWN